MLRNHHGMILVVGPTGSGKTTTLASALSSLHSDEMNIITLEDPIEYPLPAVNQTQINDKADLTFATALRAALRQDPDVIMLGEIRDRETAQTAMWASQTGHLVLSTLHTNDAPSAVTRLMDLGVEPYTISSTLLGVVAQRLVRKLCLPAESRPSLRRACWPTSVWTRPTWPRREFSVPAAARIATTPDTAVASASTRSW